VAGGCWAIPQGKPAVEERPGSVEGMQRRRSALGMKRKERISGSIVGAMEEGI
jgi:hypothetical protein